MNKEQKKLLIEHRWKLESLKPRTLIEKIRTIKDARNIASEIMQDIHYDPGGYNFKVSNAFTAFANELEKQVKERIVYGKSN